MKIVTLLLFVASTLSALPTSNPYDPTYMSKRFFNFYQGYYGDYVFNRNLETTGNEAIQTSRINTNSLYLSLKTLNRLELFTHLGLSDLTITANTFGPAHKMLEINPQDALSWGTGINAYLVEYGGFGFGVSTSYFASNFPMHSIVDMSTKVTTFLSSGQKAHYREIQTGASFSRKFALTKIVTLMPYAAIKYCDAKLMFNNLTTTLVGYTPLTLPDLQSTHNYGYTIGLELLGYERANLTFEGRFYDEKALHLNFAFSF